MTAIGAERKYGFLGWLVALAPRNYEKRLTKEEPTMTRFILVCASILALVGATAPALAGERKANDDCEARMQKLDASNAEGQERLDEKNEVIDFCGRQFKRDNMIGRLVQECAKYEEQPVVKQQFVAECELAAFNYANALHTLKAEFGK